MSIMFDNYKLGVQSTTVAYKKDSDSSNSLYISTTDYIKKDKYGNIISLSWPSSTRFELNLTSDIWVPIADGAIVFTESGKTPSGTTPDNTSYAYNTSDCKCWKYIDNDWVEQEDIIEFKNSGLVVLFSNRDCTTRVDIKNFRNDIVFTISGNNIVTINVDDELSTKLGQGFYNVDIYRVDENTTLLTRRIPLSIGEVSSNGAIGNQNNCQNTINVNKFCNITVEQDESVQGLYEAILEE